MSDKGQNTSLCNIIDEVSIHYVGAEEGLVQEGGPWSTNVYSNDGLID